MLLISRPYTWDDVPREAARRFRIKHFYSFMSFVHLSIIYLLLIIWSFFISLFLSWPLYLLYCDRFSYIVYIFLYSLHLSVSHFYICFVCFILFTFLLSFSHFYFPFYICRSLIFIFRFIFVDFSFLFLLHSFLYFLSFSI